LLLTATIRVADGLADSPIADPLRRQRDYLDCLRFYLSRARVAQVVFVENSGADLGQFRNVSVPRGVRLEVISLDQNVFPREFGKGYGEAQLMDAVMTRSELLTSATAFIKATGRLTVRNIDDLLGAVDVESSGHFDVRDHDIYTRLRVQASGHHADTRFFVVHRALFDAHFRGLPAAHAAGTFSLEANYLRAIREAERAGWRVRDRFFIEPVYGGTAGHGKDYDAWPERAKRQIRNLTRRWFPALKI
jgi:hypothetical protein